MASKIEKITGSTSKVHRVWLKRATHKFERRFVKGALVVMNDEIPKSFIKGWAD